jgi:peptidoglycan/LPS O-acetylase OafA/YrhL
MAGTGRLQAIDILRGAAALAVLVLHIPHRLPGYGTAGDLGTWLMIPIELGGLGVTLFILLSGFCIHSNTLRSAASPDAPLRPRWGAFWKRRFLRLYPPYFVTMLLSVAVIGYLWLRLGPSHSVTADYASHGWDRLAWDFLAHLLMIHNLTSDFGLALGNGPLWSLGMEEQLYLLYFAFLLIHRRWRWRGLLVAGGGVLGLWNCWQAFGPAQLGTGPLRLGSWHLWPFAFWLMWILGALAAEAHHGRVHLPRWCSCWRWGAGLATSYLLVSEPFWRAWAGVSSPLGWLIEQGTIPADWERPLGAALQAASSLAVSLAFFVLLHRLVGQERQHGPSRSSAARWLAHVGWFSYSLYLTHVLVIAVAETTLGWHSMPKLRYLAWRMVLYPPLCLGFAWLFFKLVEERFLHAAAPGTARAVAPPPRAAPARQAA